MKKTGAGCCCCVWILWCLAVATKYTTAASVEEDTWEADNLKPNVSLVPNSSWQSSFCPPRNIDVVPGRPIPTNTWWGNLVACDLSSSAISPLWPQPFAISIENSNDQGLFGLAMSYPYRARFFGPTTKTTTIPYYSHMVYKEVLVSAVEFERGSPPKFRVRDWSDLGVTVTMTTNSTTPQMLQWQLVSGMAFFTTSFLNLSPRVQFLEPIQTINDTLISAGETIQGNRFVVSTVTGKVWVIYTSTSVKFTLENNTDSAGKILRADSGVTVTLRVAPVLPEAPLAAYDQYKECVVQSGNVTIDTGAQYTYHWQTIGDCSHGLFHYALPHHIETLQQDTAKPLTSLTLNSTTLGKMTAVVTQTASPMWTMVENISVSTAFYPKVRIDAEDVQDQNITNLLQSEIMATWKIPNDGSFYTSGKLAQKYSQLCLMSNDRKVVGNDRSYLRRCVLKLEKVIAPMLNNSWTNRLEYDRIYGGIVSSEGYVKQDRGADFGNSVYNDHHYHYGYWVYTAAVLNYLHPNWSRLPELNAMARLFLRDVATPNANDPYFPKFRHFDWFRAHSYSHGVTSFADGKDEESTTEDINFSYAMFLYGIVTKHERMVTTARLMLKLGSHGIQTYFLMENTNTVHPPTFIAHKAPGILFDNKVDYATWFSSDIVCIHGIQMLPVTPILATVRTKTFIQEEWNQVLAPISTINATTVTNAWFSLLYSNYARIDRQAALPVLQRVSMDDGLSRAWAIYMAAQAS